MLTYYIYLFKSTYCIHIYTHIYILYIMYIYIYTYVFGCVYAQYPPDVCVFLAAIDVLNVTSPRSTRFNSHTLAQNFWQAGPLQPPEKQTNIEQ